MNETSLSQGTRDADYQFYFLRFKTDEITDYWINGNNPSGKACVAVYFGRMKSAEVREKIASDKLQAGDKIGGLGVFFNACESDSNRTVLVVFQSNYIVLLRPVSGISDLPEKWRIEYNDKWRNVGKRGGVHAKDEYPKICYTEELKRMPRWEVPFVLASSNADQSLNRVTCRQYTRVCHLNALNRVFLDKKVEPPSDAKSVLENLGPVELETLVFLNFHHRGLFCPANRGSTIKDVDILVDLRGNDLARTIEIEGIKFNREVTRFQVKHRATSVSEYVDYLVAVEGPSDPKVLDPEWLMKTTSADDSCFRWLKNALYWTGWHDGIWEDLRKRYGDDKSL